MSPERGSLQGLLGASVPCDVTPGPAAIPFTAAAMVPKPNPNLPRLAAIQYKNGHLRQSIVASPPLYYGIERQNQPVALEQGARDAGNNSGEDGGQASAGRNLDRITALPALVSRHLSIIPLLAFFLLLFTGEWHALLVLWCCGAVDSCSPIRSALP